MLTHIPLLKEMFQEMVVEKDATLIPKYYHEKFLLFTNEEQMDYAAFLAAHEKYYATGIQYQVDYDEETLLEQNDKVAGRIWITTSNPEMGESPRKIEVILIVQYRADKIYRIWELTFPDWSKESLFQ